MDTSRELQRAFEIVKAGDRSTARQIVKEILKVEPRNDVAWYLYARIAETRQISIHCLEKVLEINPSHSRANQDLARFTRESALPSSPKKDSFQSHFIQGKPSKQRSKRFLGWIWVIVVGLAGIVAIVCLGSIVFTLTLNLAAQPPIPITAQPFVLTTPTSDCTCSQATAYLENTFSRIDTISAQIMSIESAFDDSSVFQLNFAAFSSEAKTIYKAQLEENAPPCLQAFQNKTVSLLWNWQQSMEYAANENYDAVDVFFQGFIDDFSLLDSEGKRLLQEELNGCIMDPNTGPNL